MPGNLAEPKRPDACSFVIFGVTGDLTHRLVIPALYNLAASDLLPEKFCIVGVTRKETAEEELRKSLMEGLRKFSTQSVDDAVAKKLLGCLSSVCADPTEKDARSQSTLPDAIVLPNTTPSPPCSSG